MFISNYPAYGYFDPTISFQVLMYFKSESADICTVSSINRFAIKSGRFGWFENTLMAASVIII
jgi:hypothetical protein